MPRVAPKTPDTGLVVAVETAVVTDARDGVPYYAYANRVYRESDRVVQLLSGNFMPWPAADGHVEMERQRRMTLSMQRAQEVK